MQYNCRWKVFSQSFFTEIEINYNSSLRDVFDDIVTKYEKISVSAHTPTYDYVSVFFLRTCHSELVSTKTKTNTYRVQTLQIMGQSNFVYQGFLA